MAGLDNVGINATTGGGDWIDDDIRDGGGVVCHVLPCSIDGDSTAPIGRYFRPVPVHRILVHRRSGGGGTTTMDRLIDDGVGGASCGLGAVLGWRDLAREIHDPIPVVLP
ncbi:hypothetical protein ACHAXA_003733 [Cyclostephanos tholiformis]|uniref:Uncharacterized protein n=1 Tax=Cyclostephanos tholiformis TaxID=382380 RepID=A0ABD3SS66_9STRA